jgi:hypothetical protein
MIIKETEEKKQKRHPFVTNPSKSSLQLFDGDKHTNKQMNAEV